MDTYTATYTWDYDITFSAELMRETLADLIRNGTILDWKFDRHFLDCELTLYGQRSPDVIQLPVPASATVQIRANIIPAVTFDPTTSIITAHKDVKVSIQKASHYPGDWTEYDDLRPMKPEPKKCECGSAAMGSPRHSTWCPLFEESKPSQDDEEPWGTD